MTKTAKAAALRVREAYDRKTGRSTRAAIHLAAGHFEPVPFTEDDNGNAIRVWKASESSSYTNAMIASCLVNRVAVEANEMLGTVPMSAVRYCVTKGWLRPAGSLFLITLKGAIELNLPMRFKGIHNSRKIPFASV